MNAQLIEYFTRQVTTPEIGRAGLEKLQSSKITIAGVGGVGSSAAYYLAKSGIGNLKLIDQDIIEPTNLQRIHAATKSDLYHPKAEVLSKRLSELSKWTRVTPVVETITEYNVGRLLSDADIIFDGLDNFRTRYILNRFALRSKIPYMFVSAVSHQAHLTLLNPPNTPCLDCIMPNIVDRFQDSCEALGVSPITTGVAGALGAAALIHLLLGQPTRLSGELLTIDLTGPTILFSRTLRRKGCDSCSSEVREDSPEPPIITALCGEHTANILPPRDLGLKLAEIASIVPTERIVLNSDSVLVFRHGSHMISLFPTGRLLVGSVEEEAEASDVAKEIWQLIRGK